MNQRAPDSGGLLKPGLRPALVACLLCLVAAELFFGAFASFADYDDQGYVMITLQQYRQGQPLYDAVFSQYGPAYYLVRDWLYAGLKVTHDLTGLVYVLHGWLCCAVLGWASYRLTRSFPLALVTIALTLSRVTFRELGHPQEFLVLLVALVALVISWPGRARLRSALLGLLIGCALLTKVNVGIFLFLPAVLLHVVELPPGRLRQAAAAAVALVMVALPWAVIRLHLREGWGFSLAVVLSGSLASLVLVRRPKAALGTWRNFASFLGTLSATVSLITLHELTRGTSLKGLWQGVIGQPASFASVYTAPFRAGYPFAGLAVLGLLLFGACRRWPPPPRWVGWACGLYGLALCASLLRQAGCRSFDCVASFAWLVPLACGWAADCQGGAPRKAGADRSTAAQTGARPADGARADPSGAEVGVAVETPSDQVRSYLFLAQAAVLLVLQAYPVAGSQVKTGTVLFPVLGALALSQFRRYCRSATLSHFRMLGSARPACLLACGLLVWHAARAAQLGYRYSQQQSPALPGMSLYRLPAAQAADLRWLAENLRRFDTFVTMPGLNSLYFLTGRPPPSTLNTTAWMVLLDQAAQQQIVARLAASSNVGAVVNRELTRSWLGQRDLPRRPLVIYLEQQMKPFAARDGYELLEATRR